MLNNLKKSIGLLLLGVVLAMGSGTCSGTCQNSRGDASHIPASSGGK